MWSLDFDNPVGLAAGFDKHGEAVQGLKKVGFGFIEIGSVTPQPQEGNPKPRLFRLMEDKAIINRYGFNSEGHEAVLERLKFDSLENSSTIIGVNLGKNKDSPPDSASDFVTGVRAFSPFADYLVINVSSPNTKGLRNLQTKNRMASLIDEVLDERSNLPVEQRRPILIKIAPDLSEEDKKDIADVIMRPGKERVDGIIISNSTTSRPSNLRSPWKYERGGLTGVPLKNMSTEAIRSMYRYTNGKVQIIGVGGISTGADAYEKIRAGASLVQVYTALVYEGFPVVSKIKKELSELLRKDGFSTVSQAVGLDHSPRRC